MSLRYTLDFFLNNYVSEYYCYFDKLYNINNGISNSIQKKGF